MANTPIATDLSNVAQLIASQFQVNKVQTKIYFVTQSGYDTHSGQLVAHAKLVGDLSDALKSFQDDIEAFGIADNVAVMTYSSSVGVRRRNGSGNRPRHCRAAVVISTQVLDGKIFKDETPI